jgi:hypothetical protein
MESSRSIQKPFLKAAIPVPMPGARGGFKRPFLQPRQSARLPHRFLPFYYVHEQEDSKPSLGDTRSKKIRYIEQVITLELRSSA